MQIFIAEETGMCFGVKAALETAHAVADPRQVSIHGELVHNPLVTSELAARGFGQLPETARQELPSSPQLLITAHGISSRERRRLLAAGKSLIDTTCPLVRLVHRRAQELAAEGRRVIVVGKPGHVEVQGIVEDLQLSHVVAGVSDVVDWGGESLGVLAQSTTPPQVFEAVVAEVIRLNEHADVRVVDTVCSPTRNRQRALGDLLARIDGLVVVGDASSNNTRALVQRAEQQGVPARLVSRPAELDEAWLADLGAVGLAAGTSALDESLAAVRRALEDFARGLEVQAASERPTAISR